MLFCQINTIFVAERGVFDVSLSRGLRAGSELSGISLSSFVYRFGMPFLYLLDSSVQESRGIRAMDGRFMSKCIEQWGIASGVDGALDAKERVARGAIQERVCGESLHTHLYLVELSAQSPMVTPTSGFVRVVGSGSRMRSVRD